MRVVCQIASVLFVALGVGLLVGGSSADLLLRVENPAAVMRPEINTRFYSDLSVALKGFGAGFMTLGVLGLIVPWANVLVQSGKLNAAARPTPTTHSD